MRPLGPWSETTHLQQDRKYHSSVDIYGNVHNIEGPFALDVLSQRTGYNSGLLGRNGSGVSEYSPTSSSLYRLEMEPTSISVATSDVSGVTHYGGVSTDWLTADISLANVLSPIDYDGARREAASRMISRAQGGFNAVSALGGVKQAAAMVAHAAVNMADGFANAVSGVEKAMGRSSKLHRRSRAEAKLNSRQSSLPVVDAVGSILTDAYLEYTYGLNPLIMDLTSGAQALAQTFADVPQTRRFSGWAERTHRHTEQRPGTYAYYASNNYSFSSWIADVTVSRSFRVKYGCQERPPSENPLIALYHLGLTPGAVLNGLWDLTPWSFLIDYFCDISSYISLATFPQGLFTRFWSVEIEKTTVTYSQRATVPYWDDGRGRSWSFHGGTARTELVRYSRQPMLWSPWIERPNTSQPSMKQAANMMALAINRVASTQKSPIWVKTD